jgi:4-diphosphocytidyl-2-C-methyl-D-erythritol kinase
MPPLPTAPAKVNLFLHAGSPRADGYHPLESLVAFADCGDALAFVPGTDGFSITVDGRFASAAGHDDQNLVLRAARALRERVPWIRGGAFHLTKNIPAGAGLGGGSSDAAAALRLLAEASGLPISDAYVIAAARATGADVAVCLARKARLISGVGEILSEPIAIPPLPAVLVWPGVPSSTPAVYRAFDEDGGPHSAFGIEPGHIPRERAELLRFLAAKTNDLTRAAWRVTPEIAEADAALRAMDHARLVRMSGSGSAVFAIHETAAAAEAEAEAIRARYPEWWVAATMLR